jgi:carboxypeptidase Taq
MSFAKLDALGHKLESLEHAQAMLGVDEAVNMPSGGGEKRAAALAGLASLYHEIATAPEVADWLAAAEAEDLDEQQRVAVREFRRVHRNMTCLTSDFVARQVEAKVRAEQLWRELRPEGDWKGFLPAFESIVASVREEAEHRASVLGLSGYDALMEQYDPGARAADITPIFERLKTFLGEFIPAAMERQNRRASTRPAKPLNPPYPAESQRALGVALMRVVGFDFTHGRLDTSHHPFCGGVPSDVRMTTRYTTDEFLSSLMGILHETGHGLYEQGLPGTWSHWPSGKARGMSMHESQSLFVEKQIARSAEFWDFALPLVREHLGPSAIDGWDLDDALAHVHRIEPGLIRVDADEATYPLHVILRFEIEQDLVSGRLAPRDVPEAWDEKMRSYLGLSTIDNPADGPMQDVHWPSGAIGYFPSYTVGALIAAQLWAALERDHPAVREEIRRGEFAAVKAWLYENIWSKASLLPSGQIIRNATGEALDPRHFEAHLQRRYLS